MLALEHLNLFVKDIDTTLTFYQAAFPHWKIRTGDHDEWRGRARHWIHFGDDHQYLSFNDNAIGENRDRNGHQVGLSHFAFVTDDIQGISKRLKNVGFEISNGGSQENFRSNIYFIDPDGYEIEFVQYHSDTPEERNQSPTD